MRDAVWRRRRFKRGLSVLMGGPYLRSAAIALLQLCTLALSFPALASSNLPSSFDHAATNQKIVALTFDADMTPGMLRELKSGKVPSWYNRTVIEVLRRERVPATLFLTGLWIEAYSDAVKDLGADPLFELGNHSYSHGAFHSPCYGLFPIPESKQAEEVEKTDALLRKYAASYKKYFHFPGLCSDAQAMRTIQSQGYTAIGGDVDGADAFEKSPKWVAADVVAHVRPGSIVVLHMNGGRDAPATGNALPDMIAKLRAAGYSFVKVSDLLKLPPGEPIRHPVAARPSAASPRAALPVSSPWLHLFHWSNN
ncbi:MAG TPA: polysaccharide deacetylase family protein [Xanthobacteraceae bacterium]|jgi:peptidoglycan/xylan/chitin deacetylase (PgdA/CDA1 family)|nr:polysaccharide deacetylase family protein [Xanthobacteraceae bacterium]